MKFQRLVLSLLLCGTLCGCNSAETLVSEGKAETQPGTTASSSAPADSQAAKSDWVLLPDWSNWADGSLSTPYGSAVNLLANTEGKLMFDKGAAVKDGELSIYITYKLDADKCPYPGEADIVMFVAVNQEICNFQWNGEQSKEGFISTKRPINEELLEPITVSDCNFVEDENQISVCFVAYFPQIGRVTSNSLTRPFWSEETKTQDQTFMLDMADLPGTETLKASQVEASQINDLLHESRDFKFDSIFFDEYKICTTIAPGSDLRFLEINTADQQSAEERTTINLILKNGELIPAWNGSPFLKIASKKEDLQYNLPVDYELKPGEYALMSYTLFDLSLDAFDQQCFRLFHGLEE